MSWEPGSELSAALLFPASFALRPYGSFDDGTESSRCSNFDPNFSPVHVFSGCPNSPWIKIMLEIPQPQKGMESRELTGPQASRHL
jgi:hypothetical protein